MKHAAALFAVLMIFAAATLAATGNTSAPRMSNAQQQQLLRAACTAPSTTEGAEIKTWRPLQKEEKGRSGAAVLCPMATSVPGGATFRRSFCLRSSAQRWQCDAMLDAVQLLVSGNAVLLTYRPEQMSAQDATEIADLVGNKFGFTFAGRNLRDMMRAEGECHVEKNGPGAGPRTTIYRLSCSDRGVIVTKDCRVKACRIFPTFLSDSPVNATR